MLIVRIGGSDVIGTGVGVGVGEAPKAVSVVVGFVAVGIENEGTGEDKAVVAIEIVVELSVVNFGVETVVDAVLLAITHNPSTME